MSNCAYTIYPEKKLVIESYSENFSLEVLKELKNKEYNDDKFNKDYDIIVDFTKVNMTIENLHIKIMSFLQENKDKEGKGKRAFVTKNPEQVTGIMLFSNIVKQHLPINVEIFSTYEAAFEWLHIDDEDLLNKLKH